MRRGKEIYKVCWFKKSDFDFALKSTYESLGVPLEYLSLDSLEAQCVFYNKQTGEVFEFSLDDSLAEFKQGKLKPQWTSFNEFFLS